MTGRGDRSWSEKQGLSPCSIQEAREGRTVPVFSPKHECSSLRVGYLAFLRNSQHNRWSRPCASATPVRLTVWAPPALAPWRRCRRLRACSIWSSTIRQQQPAFARGLDDAGATTAPGDLLAAASGRLPFALHGRLWLPLFLEGGRLQPLDGADRPISNLLPFTTEPLDRSGSIYGLWRRTDTTTLSTATMVPRPATWDTLIAAPTRIGVAPDTAVRRRPLGRHIFDHLPMFSAQGHKLVDSDGIQCSASASSRSAASRT